MSNLPTNHILNIYLRNFIIRTNFIGYDTSLPCGSKVMLSNDEFSNYFIFNGNMYMSQKSYNVEHFYLIRG